MDSTGTGSVPSASAVRSRVPQSHHVGSEATAIVDACGRIVSVDGQFEKVFGYTSAELAGRQIDVLVPERFRTGPAGRWLLDVADPWNRQDDSSACSFALRKDGSEFSAQFSSSPVPTSAGVQVSVAVQDVSLRWGADERFRSFVDAAPEAVVITGSDGTILLANAQAVQMFGYGCDDLLGSMMDMLMTEPSHAVHAQQRADYLQAPADRSIGAGLDLCGQREDGTQFPLEIRLSPLRIDGRLLIHASIRDISERRARDEEHFQLAAIVESSDDAIVSTTLKGLITTWNNAAQRIFGYSRAEALARPMSMLMLPGHEDEEQEMLGRIGRGERVENYDAVRRGRDGRDIDVSISMSAIHDQRHAILTGAAQVIRDITERKRAETALAVAKELAETSAQALESFSYSVAHDLRAPLRGIAGFGQILAEDYADVLDHTGTEYLARMRTSAQQMADLIDGLLLLAQVTHRGLDPVMVDLSAIVVSAARRLRRGAPERKVAIVVQPGLRTLGDATLLTNALENLITNAWKFTRNNSEAQIEFGRDEEGYFVRDNGAGFDTAYSAKLFHAFQRLHTQQEFEGTGIGLATVMRIVRRHGGQIWAEGAVGQGATFHFTLAATPA
jgi:PAS domain S-box-containing protein